jgi:hypothetical protein
MLPTASALDRALRCPASCTLPQVHTTSKYAARGSGVHVFLEAVRAVGRDAALAEVAPEHRKLCEALPLDDLPKGGQAEVAVAWDYETDKARILGEGTRRDYSDAKPTEFVGTADLLGTANGSVVVVDWKTGYGDLPPAKEAAQLLFFALAGSRLTGLSRAHVSFVRLKDGGEVYRDSARLDAFDLEDFAYRLRRLAVGLDNLRTDTGIPDVTEGLCHYCPAFMACPAKTRHALAIANPTALGETLSTLVVEDAARAWEKLKAVEDIVKRTKKALKDYSRILPLPLSTGKTLKEVEIPDTSIDSAVAFDVLRRMFGDDIATRIPKFTQAGIKKVLPVADAKKALGEIEAAGGFVTTVEVQVRESK